MSILRSFLRAVAGSAFVVLLVGCGAETTPAPEGPAGSPRHVFLVTVDTLRADHLSAYGYPRVTSPTVEALAAEGVVFERAIAQWPKTGPSFASLFTGLYPQTTGLTHTAALRVGDEHLTIPELFQAQGYRTVAVVSNGVLGARLGWDRGFEEYLETWKLAPEESDDPLEYRKWLEAARVNELALPLLERHRDAEKLFVWLHYSDPHAPYVLPPGVENPFLGDEHYVGDEEVVLDRVEATAIGDARELRFYVAQYDANVLYADLHIGQALDKARDLGLLGDDTLVVFTADHGEALGEHDYYFGHGRLPHQPGVHVPLVLSFPARFPSGVRVERPVELVDLFPTLADLVAPGAPAEGLEGSSLLGVLEAPHDPDLASAADALAFTQAGGGSPTTHYRSVQDLRWKLVYHPAFRVEGEVRPKSWQLYRLDEDPDEAEDLARVEVEETRRLRRALLEWMKGDDWIRKTRETRDTDAEETRKTLRALGYVE